MRKTHPQIGQRQLRHALGDWRRRRLLAAGFDETLATQLSQDEQLDLHELLVLLDRGCPPALAARILGPLDRPVAGP